MRGSKSSHHRISIGTIGAFGLVLLALAVSGGPAHGQSEQWALATSSTGSGPYRWGVAIADVVNAHQDRIRVSSQTSAGFRENVLLVANGSVELALNDSSVLAAAYAGAGPFAANADQFQDLRWVAGTLIALGHCMVRADSDIHSLRDVKGHKWNINVKATATRKISERILQSVGYTVDDIRPFELPTGETFDALQNGVIDGSCNIFSVGHSRLVALSASVPVRILPFDDATFERFNKQLAYGASRVTIPAGSYRGQDEPVPTFGLIVPIVANRDMDDEKVYHFVRTFWGNLDALRKNKAFSDLELNRTMAMGPGVVPVHSGAKRFYDKALP